MGRIHTVARLAACFTSLSAILLAGAPAWAASIIKQPGNHPNYSVEVEPHLILGWANLDTNGPFPRGFDLDRHAGFGPGLRLSIPLVANGFVKSINNNVALGLGVDWAHYDKNSDVLWFPAVMQWNFYLTDVITAFGEPGFALRNTSNHDTHWNIDGVLQVGAKFMFGRYVGLTVRAGYPYFSVGVSMLF